MNNGWSKDFFEKINLPELCENKFKKIGEKVSVPGTRIGDGLTKEAAMDFGLLPGTPVGISMIDAHAGALSLFGCSGRGIWDEVTSKMGKHQLDGPFV